MLIPEEEEMLIPIKINFTFQEKQYNEEILWKKEN